MEISITEAEPGTARKRTPNKGKWKKNIEKNDRYKASMLPKFPKCGHITKSYRCGTLTMKNILNFHSQFYSSNLKAVQDAFIVKHCDVSQCKRVRPRNSSYQRRNMSIKCFVSVNNDKRIPVCQQTFKSILGITKSRIQGVMRYFLETGNAPVERRGGDHKSKIMEEQKESVITFIKSLTCIESHYCRSSSQRKYLPSNLSINKLYKMYNAVHPNKVKSSYFRKIFNTKFNLGFGTPKTDVCSCCLSLNEQIRRELNAKTKNNLIIEKRVHKLRAKAFYELLQEQRSDLVTFSFDCQKNQVLPKVADQSAYYSRQLYYYNFTIIEGHSKSKLTPQNVFSYCWTEDLHCKGSNEIGSALYHRLRNSNFDNDIKIIRLVADGCGGQNKNSIIVGVCCKYLTEVAATIKEIELVFPMTGHSFLPADRLFGNIEKELKKLETIIQPEEYSNIISKHATVIKVGTEIDVFDWKSASQNVLMVPAKWHFKFSRCKRFYLRLNKMGNVIVRGEEFYKSDISSYRNINKKQMMSTMIKPEKLPTGKVKLSREKLKDVDKLLTKHFGEDWRKLEMLSYYKNVLAADKNISGEEYVEESCEFLQESLNLTV